MAEGTVEFDKARLSTRCIESVNDVARLGGGIEPVSVKADNAESRLCLREGCGKAPAVIFRKIEIIHGAGDVEIAVCIEAIDEADPLMPQIDRKSVVEGKSGTGRRGLGGRGRIN